MLSNTVHISTDTKLRHTGRIYANTDYTLNLAETINNGAGPVAIKPSSANS
jgi:hypothetical protein